MAPNSAAAGVVLALVLALVSNTYGLPRFAGFHSASTQNTMLRYCSDVG
jgi:hypothetical protein